MTTQGAMRRLQRLEVEQRKRTPTEAQSIFEHGPEAAAMGPGYSHAKVIASLRWNSLAYAPPEAGETRTNGRN